MGQSGYKITECVLFIKIAHNLILIFWYDIISVLSGAYKGRQMVDNTSHFSSDQGVEDFFNRETLQGSIFELICAADLDVNCDPDIKERVYLHDAMMFFAWLRKKEAEEKTSVSLADMKEWIALEYDLYHPPVFDPQVVSLAEAMFQTTIQNLIVAA